MFMPRLLIFSGLLLPLVAPLHASERDALAIESTLLARHLPFGTVLNPIFSQDHTQIVGYTRCGDAALFTGLYMAAEAFRARARADAGALQNVRTALAGLNLIVDITGQDLLARCAVPVDSSFAAGIVKEESPNGVYRATLNVRSWYFIGNTSRDQYAGVFFGLGATYDLIADTGIRNNISALTTRLLKRLLQYSWNVVMPDGSVSTTFLLRPDLQLSLLQVGRHVNPQQFGSEYSRLSSLVGTVPVPLAVDALNDHSSYFKFNLDFMCLFNLIRLEDSSANKSAYESGYSVVRKATDNHINAFFNMIDRALHGPNASRDAETRAALGAWLKRSRFDIAVDWRGKIPSCGDPNEACNPIPVEERVPSDFLWQVDPFQLYFPGSGTIETAGIDYTLPYWMARFYGVVAPPLSGPAIHQRERTHAAER